MSCAAARRGFVAACAWLSGGPSSQSYAQITWGPGPILLSPTDDVRNQQRLQELLRRGYFADYGRASQQHQLLPAVRAEIAEYRQAVQSAPSLALAVGMAKYHFAWYKEASSEMDVANVEDAANLLYASIKFNGCDRVDLPLGAFAHGVCAARWPYAVMMYSELGRELAGRYWTEQAATVLEKAVAAFDEMKRLPYYSPLEHWQSPYDLNFNEEWFPGTVPSGPVWEGQRVPLALFLESSFEVIAAELKSIVDRGLFDALHFEGLRAEGQHHVPEESRRVVELTAIEADPSSVWNTVACREAAQTCALLAARPELQGCRHAGASLVRLRAGGRVKPDLSPAPKLMCHLTLQRDPAARMSVGNKTLGFTLGKAVVYDDTFIHQEWHSGAKGESYALRVSFCHPCEASQRRLYGESLVCPS